VSILDRHFERIAIISLASREDRRSRCAAHLAELGLSRSIQWFPAVDGRQQPPPPGWNSGSGAWGCHLSHVAIIEAAVRDRLHSVLIMEDDVLFSPHTRSDFTPFLKAVPGDWGQIYLGGQHLLPPVPTASPLVLRGLNVNRTHAYAVRTAEAPAILDHLHRWQLRHPSRYHHIDHHYGLAQEMRLWSAYCPRSWFAGQFDAVSDINWRQTSLPVRWWHHRHHAMSLPVIVLSTEEPLSPAQEEMLLLPATPPAVIPGDAALLSGLHRLAAEAAEAGRLPAWRAGTALRRRIRHLWHNPVLTLREAHTLCPHQTT
jgi:hypothetical protein